MAKTFKFELIVEIDAEDVEEYCNQSVTSNDAALKEITNTMYLGLSCIDGMLARQFEINGTESYVHSITDEDENDY
jgi:hypothetical protein